MKRCSWTSSSESGRLKVREALAPRGVQVVREPSQRGNFNTGCAITRVADMRDWYDAGTWITAAATFVGVWGFCTLTYGFLGFALGWMPAAVLAVIFGMFGRSSSCCSW